MKLDIISAEGNRRSFEAAENITARTRFGIEKSLYRTGKDLVGEFNRQVLDKSAKSGTIYIRKDKLGRRRRHIASAPGETPANRTGVYRRAVGFKVSGINLIFGNSAEYAGFLELGTSRMRKRPGLGNAIEASERDIMRNLTDGIVEEA